MMYNSAPAMNTEGPISSAESYTVDMQRLLRTASQQPWGPGREIDEKVHALHQTLLEIASRHGTPDEKHDDAARAQAIDHELRNKLMIFQYHEQKRIQ